MRFNKDRLNTYMERNFLTQKEMAERLGVAMGTVQRWSTGRMEPNKRSILKMAEVMGVDPLDLMIDDDVPQNEV